MFYYGVDVTSNFKILFSLFPKIKYVGDEQEKSSLEMAGLNLMDKTLPFGGARIAFSIWDVGGNINMFITFLGKTLCKLQPIECHF